MSAFDDEFTAYCTRLTQPKYIETHRQFARRVADHFWHAALASRTAETPSETDMHRLAEEIANDPELFTHMGINNQTFVDARIKYLTRRLAAHPAVTPQAKTEEHQHGPWCDYDGNGKPWAGQSPYCVAKDASAAEPERECGVQMIRDERVRQIIREHFTFQHDDEHESGDLARAAAVYAIPASWRDSDVLESWPWDAKWFKPTPDDRVRELAKAGALIAAEIDRLLRATRIGIPAPTVTHTTTQSAIEDEFRDLQQRAHRFGSKVVGIDYEVGRVTPHVASAMLREAHGVIEDAMNALYATRTSPAEPSSDTKD